MFHSLYVLCGNIVRFDSYLTHWGRDKMAAVLQTTFWNENVWIAITISLKFGLNSFRPSDAYMSQ